MNTRKRDKAFPKAPLTPQLSHAADLLTSDTDQTATLRHLDLDKIHAREQHRKYFDPTALAQLTQSIKENGLLENLIVRPKPGSTDAFELVAGERRFRAAQEAELTRVPVKIMELSDEQVLEIALYENLQRSDLNPVEKTEAIIELLAQKLAQSTTAIPSTLIRLRKQQSRAKPHESSEETAQTITTLKETFERIGITWESFTTNWLPVLNLPTEILQALRAGRIEYTKAKAIAQLSNPASRAALLEQTIKEGLSIREIRRRIKELNQAHSPPPVHRQRLDAITRQLKRTALWDEDPERWQQIEAHVNEIAKLLDLEV